jgi:hypothetical protein
VRAHETPELVREGEDDVEIGDGKQELPLALEPALGRVVAALRARAVPAGVKKEVLLVALGAHGEVSTHRRGAAASDVIECASVAWQEASSGARAISGTVATQDVCEPEHGEVRPSEVRHQAVEGQLEVLGAGLGHAKVLLQDPRARARGDGASAARRWEGSVAAGGEPKSCGAKGHNVEKASGAHGGRNLSIPLTRRSPDATKMGNRATDTPVERARRRSESNRVTPKATTRMAVRHVAAAATSVRSERLYRGKSGIWSLGQG